jgi:RNA polymerase sigma-70 factor (ECF subfamily)
MEERDEDAALMLAAKDGDDRAFEALVAKHQRPVMNFFHRLGVSMSDAEDLAQQTFIKLYRNRKTYRPTAKFTTWLYLLARQVRVDEIRVRARREKIRLAMERENEALEAMPRQAPQFGLRDDLQKALARLDEAHRDVVVLGLVQELPYQEVSEILGIPVGTVKSRMFNALKLLRGYLDE